MMKKICLVVCVVSLVCFLSGCFMPNPHLTIQGHSWTKEYLAGKWWCEITGEAINDGNVKLTYAEIWAKFYASSDTVITKELCNRLDLKVGEVWHFWILYYYETQPVRYELLIGELKY